MKMTHIHLVLTFVLMFGILAPLANAQQYMPPSGVRIMERPRATDYEDTTAYQERLDVRMPAIEVPTVVEVPVVTPLLRSKSFLVTENETGRSVPSYLNEQYSVTPTLITANTSDVTQHSPNLIDGDARTGVSFALPESHIGRTTITLSAANGVETIETSALRFVLERNVSLPTMIEIRAKDQSGAERIVLAKTRMVDTYVAFIPTRAHEFIVDLEYAQPLKINELTLIQDDPERSVYRSIRFLAQPGLTYKIYGEPDRPVMNFMSLDGDLRSSEGVRMLEHHTFMSNEWFVPADSDKDGISDVADNCPFIENIDQRDIDRNGNGDVCDDFDRDGVGNSTDNCMNLPNRDQADEDGDGIGNICDAAESRLTERLPWVPWAGMGIAGLVLLGLFVVVARRPLKSVEGSGRDTTYTEPKG